MKRYKFDTETVEGRTSLIEYLKTWTHDNRRYVLESGTSAGEYFKSMVENEEFWDADNKIEFVDDMGYAVEQADRIWREYINETPVYYVVKEVRFPVIKLRLRKDFSNIQRRRGRYEKILATFSEDEAVTESDRLNETDGVDYYDVLCKENTDAFYRFRDGEVFNGRLK